MLSACDFLRHSCLLVINIPATLTRYGLCDCCVQQVLLLLLLLLLLFIINFVSIFPLGTGKSTANNRDWLQYIMTHAAKQNQLNNVNCLCHVHAYGSCPDIKVEFKDFQRTFKEMYVNPKQHFYKLMNTGSAHS